MLRATLLLTAWLVTGCGGSSPAPAPTPTTPTPEPLPLSQVTGRVVATVTGETLAGVQLDFGGTVTTSDAEGEFSMTWDPMHSTFARLTITGPDIVPRGLTLGMGSSRDATLDAIPLGNGFDLDYYRKLVRRSLDQPESPLTLRRWTKAPRIYLKTVDEGGHPIDEGTLALTQWAIADDAAAWTGGRFGVAEVVRGPETRIGQSGWITVRWPETDELCGRAQVGVDGGWIELYHRNPACGCGGSRMGAGLIRHELGHALGFFHTEEVSDIMRARLDVQSACEGRPSARERYHAAIAYSRPVGNRDPDIDPGATIQRLALEPIVIVD